MQVFRVNASDSEGLDRLINALCDSSINPPQVRATGAPAEHIKTHERRHGGTQVISTDLEVIRRDAETRQ